MTKELSCGFILFDRKTGAVLGCHPTGRPGGPEMSYDIPKGHIENGETPIEAAKREMYEETGIILPPGTPIHEIGRVPYQKSKSLHLFSAALDDMQARFMELHCSSTFVDSLGNVKKEVDCYMLTMHPECFFKNLQQHVIRETERALLHVPVCIYDTTDSEGNPVSVRFPMTPGNKEIYVKLLGDIHDSPLYHGRYSTLEYISGHEDPVNVELESIMEAIAYGAVAVDIEGECSSLPELDITAWFTKALSPEAN